MEYIYIAIIIIIILYVVCSIPLIVEDLMTVTTVKEFDAGYKRLVQCIKLYA